MTLRFLQLSLHLLASLLNICITVRRTPASTVRCNQQGTRGLRVGSTILRDDAYSVQQVLAEGRTQLRQVTHKNCQDIFLRNLALQCILGQLVLRMLRNRSMGTRIDGHLQITVVSTRKAKIIVYPSVVSHHSWTHICVEVSCHQGTMTLNY